ncbi:MAG: quinone-dependent dihydroorotate dehydrogenase [Chitinophagaceae bacterium]|nr:quinone-dependent dihydroorotate dehydrogenase [Chitinophagaceae bacterium]MCZ2397416.1 quinone-dependent dihydroorotate dehydrogenase [Chitinophagales bacterium]
MYRIIRNLLFLFDAEKIHRFTMAILKFAASSTYVKKWFLLMTGPEDKPVKCFGLTFKNPVGLAAGFDKNAEYLKAMEMLGFGFVEIGTVTPLPQPGNKKPRLFRLPKDKALINRMGFNNDGAVKIAKRLSQFRKQQTTILVGGNIGKNKITPNEDAWKDYEKCFLTLFDVVDYFVVNVSSPNTPGLRDLQQKDSLRKILTHLQSLNKAKIIPKPILLKIAPDLNEEDLNDIIDLAMEINLDGIVATNTTISREGLSTDTEKVAAMGAGGLSGAPVFRRSTELLYKISERTGGQIQIIGSGGIMAAQDAFVKSKAGASLVQIYTGFIYAGPSLIRKCVKAINTPDK